MMFHQVQKFHYKTRHSKIFLHGRGVAEDREVDIFVGRRIDGPGCGLRGGGCCGEVEGSEIEGVRKGRRVVVRLLMVVGEVDQVVRGEVQLGLILARTCQWQE